MNKNIKAYKNYGGRSISICKRWDDFMLFVEDMGDKPDGYTGKRIITRHKTKQEAIESRNNIWKELKNGA